VDDFYAARDNTMPSLPRPSIAPPFTLEAAYSYRPAKVARKLLERASKPQPGSFIDVDLLVVDECSMVGSSLFGPIEEYAKEFNLPVVYSGDRFQLPPVGDKEDIWHQGFETIDMEGSVRFPKDSEIYRLGETLRGDIQTGLNSDVAYLTGGSEVQVLPGHEWIDRLSEGYQNGDSLLAVTFDNSTLQRLRGKVRNLNHDRLTEGDHVTSKQTDDRFRNGEQLIIKQVDRDMRVLSDVPSCVNRFRTLSLDGFAVTFHQTEKVGFVVENEYQVTGQSSRIHRLYEENRLNKAQADRILDWLQQVNRFELSALSTVHKSQGRSVDTVYIDTNTVLKRPSSLSPVEHKRLLYTAITRARKKVVFYEMSGCCEKGRGQSSIVAFGDVRPEQCAVQYLQAS
jgi:hypothetical protein